MFGRAFSARARARPALRRLHARILHGTISSGPNRPEPAASEEWAMVAEPRQRAAPQAWQAILERTLKANAVKLVV